VFYLGLGDVVSFAVGAIIGSLSENEKTARRRWHSKRVELKRTIEEHRKNIERHIYEAQESYDFVFLVDLHYSSHRVADEAYKCLNDARASIDSLERCIEKINTSKDNFKSQLDGASTETRKHCLAEIRSLHEFKENVIEDLKTVTTQRNDFFSELKRLNEQTRNLKEAIRDRCGNRGWDWYERLEQRTRYRNNKKYSSRKQKNVKKTNQAKSNSFPHLEYFNANEKLKYELLELGIDIENDEPLPIPKKKVAKKK